MIVNAAYGCPRYGGGIWINNALARPTLQNVIVADCLASGGGGIMVTALAEPAIVDSVISNNSGADPFGGGKGGGIYGASGGVRLSVRTHVAGATPAWVGAGSHARATPRAYMPVKRARIAMERVQMDNNSATFAGGGLSMEQSTLVGGRLRGMVLRGNKAIQFGGALYLTSTNVVVQDSIISGNTIAQYGGGIFQAGGPTTQLALLNVVFQNNKCGLF